MNIWSLALILIGASIMSYGAAILAAFTLPNDITRNMLVFLLILLGGLTLVACVVVSIVGFVLSLRGVA